MPVIKMLSGLPGSGKSTEAKRIVAENGNFGRINRDSLREMLFNSQWTQKREQIVIDVEESIAKILLAYDMNAVVDDCNLQNKHYRMWQTVAKDRRAAFEVQKMDTNIETCVMRDKARHDRVGKAIIHRMALTSGMIPWGDKPIVLVDIDGTIANGHLREHWVENGKKNWDAYFAEMGSDLPVDIVIRWVRELHKDHTVCLVSGRPDTYQYDTMRWLDFHDVPYDYLLMRSNSDRRSDVEVKTDILKHIPKNQVSFAIDDRLSVIDKVWRANQVKVFPVRCQDRDFQ